MLRRADASTTGRWVPVQVKLASIVKNKHIITLHRSNSPALAVQVVVQTARGPRYFGKIERNVLVFFGLHVVGVAALLLTKTHLFAVFEGD